MSQINKEVTNSAEHVTPALNHALDRTALIISAVSSPFLVIPLFALWVIAKHSLSFPQFALWGITFLICAPLPPLIYVSAAVRAKRITDIHVMVREQRKEPFIVAIIGSVVLAIIYRLEEAPQALLALAIVLAVNGLVFLIITQGHKISIHSAAFAASVLIVTYLINPWLSVSSVITVVIITLITFKLIGL